MAMSHFAARLEIASPSRLRLEWTRNDKLIKRGILPTWMNKIRGISGWKLGVNMELYEIYREI